MLRGEAGSDWRTWKVRDIATGEISELGQIFPRPGWVEHDATRIWDDVLKLIEDPFAGETPTFIRVTSSRYTFTSQHERTMTGHWWNTGQRQVWLEPIRLRRPVITHEPLELDE